MTKKSGPDKNLIEILSSFINFFDGYVYLNNKWYTFAKYQKNSVYQSSYPKKQGANVLVEAHNWIPRKNNSNRIRLEIR